MKNRMKDHDRYKFKYLNEIILREPSEDVRQKLADEKLKEEENNIALKRMARMLLESPSQSKGWTKRK